MVTVEVRLLCGEAVSFSNCESIRDVRIKASSHLKQFISHIVLLDKAENIVLEDDESGCQPFCMNCILRDTKTETFLQSALQRLPSETGPCKPLTPLPKEIYAVVNVPLDFQCHPPTVRPDEWIDIITDHAEAHDIEGMDRALTLIKTQEEIQSGKLLDAVFLELINKISSDVIQWFLLNGSNINAQDLKGNTPLMKTIVASDVEKVQLLLTKGAELSISNTSGWNALTLAANTSQQDIIEILIEAGCSIDQCDGFGMSALHSVVYKGDVNLAEWLITKCNASVSPAGAKHSPLNIAIWRNDTPMAIKLIENKADLFEKDPAENVELFHIAKGKGGQFWDKIRQAVLDLDILSPNLVDATTLEIELWKQKNLTKENDDRSVNDVLLIE